MVEFRELNLIHPWPRLAGLQMVLMRNVMIYFDVETKKTILARTGLLLDPRGYLLLGGSETTMNLDDSFEPTPVDGVICFRRRATIAVSLVAQQMHP
jgi:chemotaxis protein methyltransferase CheR